MVELHNNVDLPPFAILLELLVINHSSSERRNIFVPRWLKLSRVVVVSQLAWVRTSPSAELDNAIQFRIVSGP